MLTKPNWMIRLLKQRLYLTRIYLFQRRKPVLLLGNFLRSYLNKIRPEKLIYLHQLLRISCYLIFFAKYDVSFVSELFHQRRERFQMTREKVVASVNR